MRQLDDTKWPQMSNTERFHWVASSLTFGAGFGLIFWLPHVAAGLGAVLAAIGLIWWLTTSAFESPETEKRRKLRQALEQDD